MRSYPEAFAKWPELWKRTEVMNILGPPLTFLLDVMLLLGVLIKSMHQKNMGM